MLNQESSAEKDPNQNITMDQCIQNCLTCFKVCEESIAKYIYRPQILDTTLLGHLKACSEICQTSVKFMIMESQFHPLTCGVCADVCKVCADSCEDFDAKELKECIDACRRCAETCGEMSKMSH